MWFRLFILTACRVIENKRFLNVRVLMFPVAALIIKSFSLLSSIKKNHRLLRLHVYKTVLVGLCLFLFQEEYHLGINTCRRRELLIAFQLGADSKDWPLQEDRCTTLSASK